MKPDAVKIRNILELVRKHFPDGCDGDCYEPDCLLMRDEDGYEQSLCEMLREQGFQLEWSDKKTVEPIDSTIAFDVVEDCIKVNFLDSHGSPKCKGCTAEGSKMCYRVKKLWEMI